MSVLQYNSLCEAIRHEFSDYLDGAVNGRQMQSIAVHLDACQECAEEFAAWKVMQQTLGTLRTARAPEDLALRLRLAISHEQAALRSTWRDRLALAWDNAIRPVALQAAAGLACATALVGTIVLLLGVVPPPNTVLANDEPLGAITAPHYRYSVVSPSPIVIPEGALAGSNTTIVVQAMIDSDGRVYDYNIISAPDGPDAPAIQAQIVDQLLVSVFKPASAFGVPVRGHVLMTFSGISVHA